MTWLYDKVMRHLYCCGCGCFIPLAAVLVTSGFFGYVTWRIS